MILNSKKWFFNSFKPLNFCFSGFGAVPAVYNTNMPPPTMIPNLQNPPPIAANPNFYYGGNPSAEAANMLPVQSNVNIPLAWFQIFSFYSNGCILYLLFRYDIFCLMHILWFESCVVGSCMCYDKKFYIRMCEFKELILQGV